MNCSVSIECLFGHLCSGSTFAHDEDMKLLARQRETLKIRESDRDSQTRTSSREVSPASLLGSGSDPETHALDDLERLPKRIRTRVSSPKRKLPGFKQNFRSFLKQRRKEKISPTSKSTDPLSNYISDRTSTSPTAVLGHQGPSIAPDLENDQNANTQNENLANRTIDVHRGTQAAPIELSDGDPFSQGNEAGEILLEDMPEPTYPQNTLSASQVDLETQVTLSDAAFESQSSHNSDPDIKAMILQKRKEAYKAAKEPSGIWETDYRLISLDAHHGEEEVEL